MKFVDYYEILGVSFNCSKQDIKRGFKEQAIKWHPDKNIGLDTTERMQLINEAKLILCDDEAKKRYDVEYIRYKDLISEKTNQSDEPECQEYQQNEYNNSNSEFYYEYQDDILKDWILKAKKQAIEYAKQTIKEIRELSIIGIKEGGKEMGRYLIAFIIISLLFSLIFAILN